MIVTIILLLSRPVLRGYFQGSLSNESSILSVVVIDDSFSMNGDINGSTNSVSLVNAGRGQESLSRLFGILSEQRSSGKVIAMRTSDGRVIFDGRAQDLPSSGGLGDLTTPGYRSDDLSTVLDTLNSPEFQEAAKLFANRELYIISDFQVHQQNSIRSIGSDSLWSDWHVFMFPSAALEHNVAVINTEVKTMIPLVGELMDVTVTLKNTGTLPQQNVPVQVVLNDIRSGQLVVDLNPGETRAVTFRVAPLVAGHQQGYAEIERDDRTDDNRFYFHTYIPPQVDVLLLEPSGMKHSFVRIALEALESQSPQIILATAEPNDLTWNIDTPDIIILNGVQQAPRLFSRQILAFLDEAGTLIVVPAIPEEGAANGSVFLDQFGLPRLGQAPLNLGVPLALDDQQLSSSMLAEVFRHEEEMGDLPKVEQLLPLGLRGNDEVVLQLTSEMPILAHTQSGQGHIFMFALHFNLEWTDMPLHGSFIPLWHRLIFWQSNNEDLNDLRVGDRPSLTVTPRQATQTMSLLAPRRISSLVIPDIRTRTITLPDLHEPGIYTLSSDDGASTKLSEGISFQVNIPNEELTAAVFGEDALGSLISNGSAHILTADEDLSLGIISARFGRELARPLIYFLILLILTELIISNIYSAHKRHQ